MALAQNFLMMSLTQLCLINTEYYRFPTMSESEGNSVVEMNNYLDERLIALISDYMDLNAFNALRQSCISYKRSCDQYSLAMIEAQYFSLLQHAKKLDLGLDAHDLAAIRLIDKFPVNTTDIPSFFERHPFVQTVRGIDILPFIAFKMFNQQNVNEKMYIIVSFNGTRIQNLRYQIRKQDKLMPLRNAKIFREGSDNFDIIILELIQEHKTSNVFSFADVSWISEKTYFSRVATFWYNLKAIQVLLTCFKANEKKIKIGLIGYSLYYFFWILFFLIK